MHLPTSFTIRVYGILMDKEKGILITDEFENGKRFSKFPGGGLELGEGIRDCLLREWKEELGQTIEIIEHFYTTDFLQISAFNPEQQVISIYFLVKALNEAHVKISDVPFDFAEGVEGAQSFRWVAMKNFSEEVMTFPIDKMVAGMIADGEW
ncbi:MAG TPA: NUDIX domain-containing protein [Chitinophagales bacterium]|nr:NUDIX domain-containing protein [Chitinophagales bacterium]